LLSLLALKQTGANPSALLETVQPSIDLTMFFGQRLMLDMPGLFPSASGATAALVNGNKGVQNFTGCVVPVNETWLCYAAHAFINNVPAADTVVNCAVGYISQVAAGTGLYLLSPPNSDAVTARARSFITSPIYQATWLPPGAQMFFWLGDILTATSITATLFMRAARFLI
jgi:hypothetical protein